jgi:hypothetical protein
MAGLVPGHQERHVVSRVDPPSLQSYTLTYTQKSPIHRPFWDRTGTPRNPRHLCTIPGSTGTPGGITRPAGRALRSREMMYMNTLIIKYLCIYLFDATITARPGILFSVHSVKA